MLLPSSSRDHRGYIAEIYSQSFGCIAKTYSQSFGSNVSSLFSHIIIIIIIVFFLLFDLHLAVTNVLVDVCFPKSFPKARSAKTE